MQTPTGYRVVVQDPCRCLPTDSVTRRDLLRFAATAPAVLGLSSLVGAVAAPEAAAAPGIAGMIVFLDPGHNGANDSSINRQVTNGRGGT